MGVWVSFQHKVRMWPSYVPSWQLQHSLSAQRWLFSLLCVCLTQRRAHEGKYNIGSYTLQGEGTIFGTEGWRGEEEGHLREQKVGRGDSGSTPFIWLMQLKALPGGVIAISG